MIAAIGFPQNITQIFYMTQAPEAEDYSRPWAIIRWLPDARRYTVARFYNSQDAEDHRRFLHRVMPASEFIVLFDVPNEQLQQPIDQQED